MIAVSGSFESFADVQERCAVDVDWNDHTIETWAVISKKLYSQAQVHEDSREFIEAYICYSRTYDICYHGQSPATKIFILDLMTDLARHPQTLYVSDLEVLS